MRHAKVDYTYQKMCNSYEFDKACNEYDTSPIIIDAKYDCNGSVEVVYVSSLPRTHDTAKWISPNGNYLENNLFDEVPIKSFATLSFPVPVRLWFFIGRAAMVFRLGTTAGKTQKKP